MFRLYTVLEAFENIFFFEEDKYPNWKKIISKNIDICLDIATEELDAQLNDPESIVYLFVQGSASAKVPIPLKSDFQNFKNNVSEFLAEPRSTFILDINQNEADKLQHDLGMAIFSKDKINDDLLVGGFMKEVFGTEKIAQGWKGLIDRNFKLPPSNSLIISDNFLFSNEEARENLGIGIIPNLLDAILPENLSIDFHITIIAQDANKSKSWWDSKFGQLTTKIKKLRSYPIKLELVLAESIHKRIIVSNYLNGWGDKGFDIFKNSDPEAVRGVFDIHLHKIFNNPDECGDTHFKLSQNQINQIKVKCRNVAEFIKNNKGQASNRYILGDCNSDKSIKNRLFQ